MPFPRRCPALCGLLALCGAILSGCGDHSATSNVTEAPAAASQVVIDNFTYSPVETTVAVGTKVTWTNHDDVPHTVTSTSKPRLLDSPTLDSEESFAHVFTTPGTYEYYCAVHPKMTGRIIVK